MIKKPIKNEINLYAFYPGRWINTPQNFNTRYFSNIGFTHSDYYIINRRSITAERITMVEGIEPLFTLSYRGFVQAWVYRGDQLKPKQQEITSQWESAIERYHSRQQY